MSVGTYSKPLRSWEVNHLEEEGRGLRSKCIQPGRLQRPITDQASRLELPIQVAAEAERSVGLWSRWYAEQTQRPDWGSTSS